MSNLIAVLIEFWSLNCPRCKKAKINDSLIKIHQTCPNCKLVFRSDAEGWAGPALINYSVTVVVVIACVVISLVIFKWQYLERQAIFAILLGVANNILFYRFAHSFWVHFLYKFKFPIN